MPKRKTRTRQVCCPETTPECRHGLQSLSTRWACGLIVLLLASQSAAEVLFSPVKLDFDHQYAGGWEYFVGGGVSSFDCDADGMAELFVAGGENNAALLRNITQQRSTDQRHSTNQPQDLTRQDAAPIRFRSATPAELQRTGVIGSYPLDIDSDGKIDLVVLRLGRNLLLRGLGDCQFEEFPTELGFHSGQFWTTAFSATWEHGSSLPTLAFGNYVDRDNPAGPFGTCAANRLYRPNQTVYEMPQLLIPGHCALSMLFSDWGRIGRMDIRISNDRHYHINRGSEQLWAMEPIARLYTAVDGWKDYSIWGMGIASRDISGDGKPEIFLTSMGDQKLHQLVGNGARPTYQDSPYDRGITAHRPHTGGDGRPSTGWHAEFADFNNDGLDDIFIAKGNVEQMPGSAMIDPNNLLVQQIDGRFIEYGNRAGVASPHRGRGAALADLNSDGLLDLVVVNRRHNLEIYQNVSRYAGNWLQVELQQNPPNTWAIGAWIELKSTSGHWHRELTVGGGHASGNAGPQHFGLGNASRAELRAIWPDGQTSQWIELDTNQRITLQRSGDGRLALIAQTRADRQCKRWSSPRRSC
jgi:hypothetical protein